jgi:hypothetical protein
MANLWIDLRDIKFQLFEVFKIGETLLGKGRYADYDAIRATWFLTRRQSSRSWSLPPPILTKFIVNLSKQHGKTEK